MHFPHQATDGSWHAVYRIPATQALSSIGSALSLDGAKLIADEANRQQRTLVPPADPYDRKLPAGLYTDEDAR